MLPRMASGTLSVRRDSYPVEEHAEVLEVIRTVDPAAETEDIVIYLTDLPRRLGTTPVIADISVQNRFGLISIPGVGGLFIDRRVRNLAQTVVAEVTCQSNKQHRSVRRLTLGQRLTTWRIGLRAFGRFGRSLAGCASRVGSVGGVVDGRRACDRSVPAAVKATLSSMGTRIFSEHSQTAGANAGHFHL
jgi:hypothetical protein